MISDFSAEIAARTVWMEARGEGEIGMQAVAHVIVNRLQSGRWGKTLASVCLAPLQFSSWNTRDPNRVAMAALPDNDALLQKCRDFIAAAPTEADPTNGATFYFADYIPPPQWSESAKLEAKIGRQLFYSGVT